MYQTWTLVPVLEVDTHKFYQVWGFARWSQGNARHSTGGCGVLTGVRRGWS